MHWHHQTVRKRSCAACASHTSPDALIVERLVDCILHRCSERIENRPLIEERMLACKGSAEDGSELLPSVAVEETCSRTCADADTDEDQNPGSTSARHETTSPVRTGASKSASEIPRWRARSSQRR